MTYYSDILITDVIVDSDPSGVVLLHVQWGTWGGAIEYNRVSCLAINSDIVHCCNELVVWRGLWTWGGCDYQLGPKDQEQDRQHGSDIQIEIITNSKEGV